MSRVKQDITKTLEALTKDKGAIRKDLKELEEHNGIHEEDRSREGKSSRGNFITK